MRVPLVNHTVAESAVVSPSVVVALANNLLDFALLAVVELLGESIRLNLAPEQVRHTVIDAVESLLFLTIEFARPEAARAGNVGVCRAVEVAGKVEHHTQVEDHGTVGQALILREVVVGNFECVHAVALIEAWIGVINTIGIHVIDVPRGGVGDRLITAVLIHPHGILFQVVIDILGDILLRLLGEVALRYGNDGGVAETTPRHCATRTYEQGNKCKQCLFHCYIFYGYLSKYLLSFAARR